MELVILIPFALILITLYVFGKKCSNDFFIGCIYAITFSWVLYTSFMKIGLVVNDIGSILAIINIYIIIFLQVVKNKSVITAFTFLGISLFFIKDEVARNFVFCSMITCSLIFTNSIKRVAIYSLISLALILTIVQTYVLPDKFFNIEYIYLSIYLIIGILLIISKKIELKSIGFVVFIILNQYLPQINPVNTYVDWGILTFVLVDLSLYLLKPGKNKITNYLTTIVILWRFKLILIAAPLLVLPLILDNKNEKYDFNNYGIKHFLSTLCLSLIIFFSISGLYNFATELEVTVCLWSIFQINRVSFEIMKNFDMRPLVVRFANLFLLVGIIVLVQKGHVL